MKRINVTLKDIARWRRQGKGLGTGKDYQPWLKVRDVPSLGRSHRIKGIKTGRIHHLLSDLEFQHFLLMEYNSQVVDIREQFPLFPIDLVMGIAKELSITYPRYPGSQTPYVMTTDIVVTILDETGKSSLHARSIKYAKDLDDKRALEKLELERVFWENLGVSWDMGVDNLNKTLIANLEWLRPHLAALGDLSSDQKLLIFLVAFTTNHHLPGSLRHLLETCAQQCNISYQDAMLLFRHLVWHRLIPFDVENTRIDLRSPAVFTHPMEDIQRLLVKSKISV